MKKGGTKSSRRSTSGTDIMVNFTARDISSIIKTCASHGVHFIKVGELEIRLGSSEVEEFYPDVPGAPAPVPRMELTEEQRQEMAFAERQEMMAMNPVAFEQSVVDESEASLYEDTYDQEY